MKVHLSNLDPAASSEWVREAPPHQLSQEHSLLILFYYTRT